MRKLKLFILIMFVVLGFSTLRAKATGFVPFDMHDWSGTYAKTSQVIYVVLDEKTDVNDVYNGLTLTDSNDNTVTLDRIVALNDIGGKATRFKIELDQPLSNDETYTFSLRDNSHVLYVNYAPMISYTNNVKNNPEKYNEKTKTYLLEEKTQNIFEKWFGKKETFDITSYIRLNVVDDRDGSLLDQVKIENLPDLYKPGIYDVKVSATDSWGKTGKEFFHFEVVETNDNTDLYINIGAIASLVLIVGIGGFTLIKLKRR